MSRRGFTVIELVVAVLVMLALVSFSVAGFQRYRDRAAMLVDETNQKVLLAAVKLYAYDNNALPGSLSQLRHNHLERAYALITEGKRPYTFLAFLEERLGLLDIAEAVPLPSRYLGDNPQKILTCPMDLTPPSEGGVSYGMHKDAANKPLSWLLNPANASRTCLGESDVAVASDADFARRHDGGRTFVKVSASGIVDRDTAGTGSSDGGSSSGGGSGSITGQSTSSPPLPGETGNDGGIIPEGSVNH